MHEPAIKLSDLKPLSQNQVGLAVLGFPINHSISPQLHNAALGDLSQRHSEFNNWVYHKIEVDPKNLSSAMVKLADYGYRGLNLTIPHKVDVLLYLNKIEESAKAMGAVNTLLFNGSEWEGFNTDGYGLEKALKEDLSVSIKTENLVFLGAGGAARACVAHALAMGSKSIWIGNRSSERLKELIKSLETSFDVSNVNTFTFNEVPDSLFQISDPVIINATSLGLGKTDTSAISLKLFFEDLKVYDMIYNPSETKLLQEAKSMNFKCSNGLSMLVHQAVRSLEIWTRKKISVDAMSKAAKLAFSQ